MGVPVNLIGDGYEAAAKRITSVCRRTNGNVFAIVRPDGSIRCEQESKLPSVRGARWFVLGPYDNDVRIEWVEDDLIEAMRTPREEAA